jgi:hypothetical protein
MQLQILSDISESIPTPLETPCIWKPLTVTSGLCLLWSLRNQLHLSLECIFNNQAFPVLAYPELKNGIKNLGSRWPWIWVLVLSLTDNIILVSHLFLSFFICMKADNSKDCVFQMATPINKCVCVCVCVYSIPYAFLIVWRWHSPI